MGYLFVMGLHGWILYWLSYKSNSLKTFLCIKYMFQNICTLRETIYHFKAKTIINLYLVLNSLYISQIESLWFLLTVWISVLCMLQQNPYWMLNRKIFDKETSLGAPQNHLKHWALKMLNTFQCELLYDKELIFKMFIFISITRKTWLDVNIPTYLFSCY